MAALPVEERVSILEQELANLKAKLSYTGDLDKPWLDRIFGAFQDNSVFKEAMDLGREYRESLRPKPKKSTTRKKGK